MEYIARLLIVLLIALAAGVSLAWTLSQGALMLIAIGDLVVALALCALMLFVAAAIVARVKG